MEVLLLIVFIVLILKILIALAIAEIFFFSLIFKFLWQHKLIIFTVVLGIYLFDSYPILFIAYLIGIYILSKFKL